MDKVDLATIGFTKSSAKHFFARLRDAGIKRLIDVRLHNRSQLAGFAKADDLAYFLEEIAGIRYTHLPIVAPTEDMLTAYLKNKGPWEDYEKAFLALMAEREIETELDPGIFEGGCLMCAEATPHHCHRRLVCDYLNDKWSGALRVRHL